MSILDLDRVSKIELLNLYFSEVCGKSLLLNRDDYEIICEWLVVADGSVDLVMLVLDSELSHSKIRANFQLKPSFALKKLKKIVSTKLCQLKKNN